jgi:hypothetical protein
MRRTFQLMIEPCAVHAARKPDFADFLNTAVFFPKRGFASFIADFQRAW